MMDSGMVEWDGRKHELNADETAVVLLEDELGRPLRRGEWYEKVCGEDDCVNPAHIQLVAKRGAKGDIVGADAARKTCDATADMAVNLMLFRRMASLTFRTATRCPKRQRKLSLKMPPTRACKRVAF